MPSRTPLTLALSLFLAASATACATQTPTSNAVASCQIQRAAPARRSEELPPRVCTAEPIKGR